MDSTSIQVLHDQLINQIAAGEVVERPASVVKELTENAIDADSRHILVSIEEGGLKSIEVEDDGSGIRREEIPYAFLRHATSKIRCEEDLYRLNTLGFRGEALPSIASVSRMKVYSACAGAMGSEVWMEGGTIQQSLPCSMPQGTRMVVQDLFFNTPARRKFMKSPTTEFHKVYDFTLREALSRLEISFTFRHNGKVYFKTPGSGQLKEAVAALWGKKFLECFTEVNWQGEAIRVHGLISRPEYKRGNRQRQIFFVNRRVVQDVMLSRAVDEGYKGLLISKEYPAVVLFLELPTEDVDCNMHPQKMQVRFREEGKVFQVVKQVIRSVLGEMSHQLDLGVWAARNEAPTERGSAEASMNFSWEKPGGGNHSMYLLPETSIFPEKQENRLAEAERYPAIGEGLEDWEAEIRATEVKEPALPVFRVIGQAFQGYILLEYADKMWLVDQHAAHERINYNLILQKLREGAPLTQMLILPLPLEVTPQEMDLISAKQAELSRLGFVWDNLGEGSLMLRGVPETCADAWEHSPDTVEALLDIISASSLEKMAARLACKKSVKEGEVLTVQEMEQVIHRLLQTDDFRHCPHGRPTFIEITHTDLEKKFKRI